MKKILSFGCDAIAYNDTLICSGGNQIGLVDRSSGLILGILKGARNIISLQVDSEYIYAKTTAGIYCVFDLKSKELKYKNYCRDKKNTSHDGKFFLYDKCIILDILKLKDDFYYLIKYDITSCVYEKVCISKNNFVCKDWYVDRYERKAYVLLLETCCLNHLQTNCYITVINIDDFQIEEENPLTFEYGIIPIGFAEKDAILLNNMQIADVISSKRFLLNSQNYFKDKASGYFVKMKFMSEKQIILIFSECVLIYDLSSSNLIKKYDCQYGANAACIDDKTYFATWNGLFVTDE